MTNFQKEVKLFMIFDILGDTERTGPHLWQIKRERLEDVKNHILDLLLIYRIIKQHLPQELDYNKIIDIINNYLRLDFRVSLYAMIHFLFL